MRRGLVIAGVTCALLTVIILLPGYPPATAHPFFKGVDQGQVEIIAHGAGQGVAPTNTLFALRKAKADRADILEIDVQLTRDNILVLHHDDTLDRTTGLSGPVAAKTWAQISTEDKGEAVSIGSTNFQGEDTKVARLDVALATIPDARWNIEIKNNSAVAARQLCENIKQAGIEQKTLVASFHDEAMREFRKLCPQVATSMAPDEIRAFVLASKVGLSRFVKTPAVAVQVPVTSGSFDLTNARFIAALKARNIKLHFWTINDSGEMRALIDAGADGILTDYVSRGFEAVAR